MEKEHIKFKIPQLSFNISHVVAQQNSQIRGPHSHNAVELMKVNEGTVLCNIENNSITMESGDIILISSKIIHQIYLITEAKLTYIQIDVGKHQPQATDEIYKYISRFITKSRNRKHYIQHKNSELSTLFNLMEKEAFEERPFYQNYLMAYIQQLIAFMYRHMIITDFDPTSIKHINDIMPAVTFIDKHYNSKIYLDTLGASIGYDKFQLCRIFKKVTNQTVVDYINFVRLQKAEQMLLNTNKNISEISFSCGFASLQYFNKVFRKNLGCTPRDYRKLLI